MSVKQLLSFKTIRQPTSNLSLLFFFIMLLIVFFCCPVAVTANDNDSRLNEDDTSQYDTFIDELDKEMSVHDTPNFSLKDYLSGQTTFSFREYVMTLIHIFFNDITTTFQMIEKIIIYLVLSLFLTHFFHGKFIPITKTMTLFILKLALIKESLVIYHLVESVLRETIETMYGFLVVLYSSISGISLVLEPLSMLQSLKPLQLFFLPLSLQLLKQILLPLIYFHCLIALIGELFELLPLKPLAKKLASWLHYSLSMLLKVYFSFLMLSSSFRFFQTRLALMQEKHLVSQLYTLTGRLFQETAEMSFLTLGVLRDALSVYGVITLIILMSVPFIKLISIYMIVTLTETLVQIVSQSDLVHVLTIVSRSVALALRALIVFTFLFIGNILVIMVFTQFFNG